MTDKNSSAANAVFDRGKPGSERSSLLPGKHPMDLLLKQRNEFNQFLKPGDIVEGEVIEKKGARLFVDLGRGGMGIVYGREYYAAQDIVRRLNIGERITAKVIESDNDEGYAELSLKEAGREKNWQELKRLMETAELITLKVLEANRGGLILEHLGVSGFLPASQLSQEHYPRVEGGDKDKIFEELKKLVGETFEVVVIDVNTDEGKLIFSEKSKETEALKQRLSIFHVGDAVEGEIAGLVSFGAFVKFGDGLEGLVHISEIDWQLIQNPADVLKIGERVRAKIIGLEGGKVSLSLKALKEDPWSKAGEKYKKGDIVSGIVVKFNPFGAFIKLDEDIQGLAHISEFGTEAKMKEILTLNQPHQFKVLSVDAKEHRLALGLVKEEPPAAASVPEDATAEAPAASESPAPAEDTPQSPATPGL